MKSSDPAHVPAPVAIIGMGCLFPRADGLARYWANIRTGVDAITDVPETHWSVDDYFDGDPKAPDRTYARRGGFLEPVDFPPLEFGIAPNAIEAIDTTQLLGLLVARRALEDAGYGEGRAFDRERVSVILGVTGTLELVVPLAARLGHPVWRRALRSAGVDDATADDVVRRISSSYVGWQENSFPGLLGNVVAGRIANRLDLRGTNCVVDAACASSLGAVNTAILELASGRSDIAVTGGLDTFNDIFMYMCFSKTPALSPTGEARPFDAEADGTILGEGLGVVVLKRLSDARRDGDRVYAVIRAIGTSSDGKGQAVYAPSVAGQVRALRQAYSLAGISPATVGLVEAHGTGTRVGDAIELQALEEVYGAARPGGGWCALGSVKSQMGHTKAAAGAAGLIKAAMALHHKVLPPTLKVRRPSERVASGESPFHMNAEARPWLNDGSGPRRAAVSAFGFGGSNFHCVLEEAEPENAAIDWDGDVQILAFSADDRAGIARELEALGHRPEWAEVRAIGAQSRASFRPEHRHRLVIVARRSVEDWDGLMAEARVRGERGASASGLLDSGQGADAPRSPSRDRSPLRKGTPRIFIGTGPRPGGLALLFPGQGSQYLGMLRELACLFPRMQAALIGMNEAAREAQSTGLASDRIYPPAAFDDRIRQEREDALRDTRFAQPAIGAVSRGLLGILEDFGVRPEMAGGHSFGELTALRAAGRIGDATLGMLAHRRGALMADCAAGGSGGMLAVFAPIAQVATAIREHSLDLVIANRNAPRQCVLSGPVGEIDRGRRVLADRGITTRAIPVSAAFHSRFVAAAREPFRRTLELVEIAPSTIPVFANATAAPYPDDPRAARDLLAEQLARPVEFVDQIEAMYRMGARTFLEVGPDARLTGLVRSILEGREHTAIAVDASRGADGNVHDLACSLATLAALGYAVDLTLWDAGYPAPAEQTRKPGLTVRISGANPRPAGVVAADPPSRNGFHPAPIHARESMMTDRFEPRDPAENDRTMNPPERLNSSPHHHQKNGQAAPASVARPMVVEPDEPSTSVMPARTTVGGSSAFREAQENLAALQRMAERTADLHRMFLEGQEKAQQAFLKLLDQQHRIATATPVRRPDETALPSRYPAATAHGNGSLHAADPLPEPDAAESKGDPAEWAKPTEPPTTEPSAAPSAFAPPTPIDGAAAALIAVVAEKTGYPADALDLDMRLDDDLGIDSIKRVEILSALQERHPALPAPPPDRLGSFHTLRAIAEFLAGASDTAPAPADAPAEADPTGDLARVVLETVAEKTGYPAEMLELPMRLDDDLGIDSIKRVEILSALQERFPEMPPASPERIGTLGTLRDIVGLLAAPMRPTSEVVPLPSRAIAETPTTADDSIALILLEAVAEKTGYPVEMLELPMRLDDDLGIDSIKRVEILSAVQDRLPGTRSIGPDQTGTLRTLGDIVEFLATPDRPAPDVARAGVNGKASASPSVEVKPIVEEPRAVLRRLEPRAVAIAAPERRDVVRLSAGGTIWITDDGSALTQALRSELVRRGFRPRVIAIDETHPPSPDENLCGLIVLSPAGRCPPGFVAAAFRTIRAAGPALDRASRAGGASLLTVSRLDGRFGVEGLWPEIDITTGALAGLSKTAGREWTEIHCKALDLGGDATSSDRAAAWIVDELLARGPSEVGLDREGPVTLEVAAAREPSAIQGRRMDLGPDDLVVVSGGARGITAEVAVALARTFRPRLLILGRSPAPEGEEEPRLAACRDEAELKRCLLSGADRPSPQAITHRVRRILADREIRGNLDRIAGAGSRVAYRSVDVRDAAAVRDVIARAREEHGPVRGLIHGAGVLADRRIVDQTDAQFSLVYDTKVAGLHNLFDAADPEALAFLVLFSSSTARFGRTGQVAYAAANEYLNKWAQQAAIRLPDCRVVSFNWGPWDGGMVGDALRSIFENEGLHLIPPADGARLVIEEIQNSDAGPGPVEIVVLADRPVATAPEPAAVPNMARASSADRALETVLRRDVDLKSAPILADHVIDGHAVLPMAMFLEWAVEAAVQRNPGLVARGVDDLRLFKGVVLNGRERAVLDIGAGKAAREGDEFRVPVEFRGTLSQGREVIHARAEVVLAARHASGTRRLHDPAPPRPSLSHHEIYGQVLFHGPAMQGIERVEGCGERGISGRVRTSSLPSEWLERPLRSRWLTDPLAIDCAFQLVVLWTRDRLGANSLPTAVGRYRQFRPEFGPAGVRVVAEIRQATDARAVADIEFVDGHGELVARLESYECVVDASLSQAFRRNQLTAPTPVTAS